MAKTWSAVLARLGVPTGDDRILAPGGITHRDLPLPLMWQRTSGDGHSGSVVVGAIETLAIDNESGMVTGTGRFLDVRGAADAERQVDAGVTGPSVDLFDDLDITEVQRLIEAGVVGPDVTGMMDDIEYVMDDVGRMVIISGRIAGATLVAVPAFAEVSIDMVDNPGDRPCLPDDPDPRCPDYALTASVRSSGWSDMPIADEGRAWDGSAAAGRVFSWATKGDTTDWGKYARAFLRKDDDANPETRGAYGFGISDVIGGTLTIVPRGVFAAAAAVQGARTGSAPEDAEGMKRVLAGIYRRMDRTPPWAEAALMASADRAWAMSFSVVKTETRPPLEWFMRPDVDRVTPLTISDTGRVFGHIAPWGQCHVGLPGCVTAPSSPSNYAYFLQGEQTCQDGTTLPVGTLVAGPRHADAALAFQAATQHYDDPKAAVAKVMAGEDEFGIWVAGWMLPGATEEAVNIFRSSPVSGDWRRIGGNLEMIAVCSVNSAGFPVPRARVNFASGRQRTLIASFGVTPVAGEIVHKVPEPFVSKARAAWARAQWNESEGRR